MMFSYSFRNFKQSASPISVLNQTTIFLFRTNEAVLSYFYMEYLVKYCYPQIVTYFIEKEMYNL